MHIPFSRVSLLKRRRRSTMVTGSRPSSASSITSILGLPSIAAAMDKSFLLPAGYEDMFWDDVVDSITDELKLRVWPIKEGTIAELDTPEELYELEAKLKTGEQG